LKQQIPPEAIAAWERGDRLDAIRLLRERTGLGLKEAKEALESGSYRMASKAADIPANAAAEAARGNMIEAIRLTREATGLGLSEARDLVESALRRQAALHAPGRRLSPGEVPRSSRSMVYILLAAILLLLSMYYGFPR
jgi:ribosomal protein L7/L12